MKVDRPLLVNMIAHGLQAASEALHNSLEVTLHEGAGIVYVRTVGGELFRVYVEAVGNPKEAAHG